MKVYIEVERYYLIQRGRDYIIEWKPTGRELARFKHPLDALEYLVKKLKERRIKRCL